VEPSPSTAKERDFLNLFLLYKSGVILYPKDEFAANSFSVIHHFCAIHSTEVWEI
jgi:hypothetical protein